jgi:hypothetical protein
MLSNLNIFVAHRRGSDKDPVVAAFLKNFSEAVANS